MYRSIYGSSLISTASGHFLSATLALTLTPGNPRGRSLQRSGPAYSYTCSLSAPAKGLTADSASGAENTISSGRAVFRA